MSRHVIESAITYRVSDSRCSCVHNSVISEDNKSKVWNWLPWSWELDSQVMRIWTMKLSKMCMSKARNFRRWPQIYEITRRGPLLQHCISVYSSIGRPADETRDWEASGTYADTLSYTLLSAWQRFRGHRQRSIHCMACDSIQCRPRKHHGSAR